MGLITLARVPQPQKGNITTKFCNGECQRELPRTDFYKSGAGTLCKKCCSKRSAERVKEKKENSFF